jgi:hypothetical protein
MRTQWVWFGLALATACSKDAKPPAAVRPSVPPSTKVYDQIQRPDFNRWAVRENLPVYWSADRDQDGRPDPDEIVPLLFYPTRGQWTANGAFTPAFEQAYDRLVAAALAQPTGTPEELARQSAVGLDLDQGRATLVENDFSKLSADERAFVGHMLEVARQIDELYDLTTGSAALAPKVAADPASQSLFRRNRGPRCVAPATEKNPVCSAIPGNPRPIVDIYPPELQADDGFCAALEQRPDARTLLAPFVVVRAKGKTLEAVPYHLAYATQSGKIAAELETAAKRLPESESALVAYLTAAAAGFRTNDWQNADEAWAKMNAENSKWYVRVAPDETYWDPCAQKAGYHLTFALINQGSLAWQKKLVPVQQEMEQAIADAAGKPYKARTVTFHLPDFIDIVVNAGDDRDPLGATIGQSLPNWGPVANEGRGRTVAMSNLYGDPDSVEARKSQAASLLDATTMAHYATEADPGLLTTILHEACHNLGPAHEYKVAGKTDDAAFGGQIASVLEELKAQTAGLYLVEFARKKGLISDTLAKQAYVDSIAWAFGHIAQGMYTASGQRKAYSQLAAIQIGYFLEKGALRWDENALAANGTDKGAVIVDLDKLVPVIADLTKVVAGIKARGDKKGAEALLARYVDGKVVGLQTITERWLRAPKASFVYRDPSDSLGR